MLNISSNGMHVRKSVTNRNISYDVATVDDKLYLNSTASDTDAAYDGHEASQLEDAVGSTVPGDVDISTIRDDRQICTRIDPRNQSLSGCGHISTAANG